MNNYIEVQNNFNKIVVNDTYKNLSLKRVVRNINRDIVFSIYHDPSDIVFFRNVPIGVCIGSRRFSNYTTFYFTKIDSGQSVANGSINQQRDENSIKQGLDNIVFYIFGEVSGQGNVGLQVFNEAGENIFNSNNRYLQVIGFFLEQGLAMRMTLAYRRAHIGRPSKGYNGNMGFFISATEKPIVASPRGVHEFITGLYFDGSSSYKEVLFQYGGGGVFGGPDSRLYNFGTTTSYLIANLSNVI